VYETVYLAHLGDYSCPNCEATRPSPTIFATEIELNGTRSSSFILHTTEGAEQVHLPLPGIYNVYNALGAAAVCHALNIPLSDIAEGLSSVAAAFGRAEMVELEGREASILLIKNPAGANEVLRTLALQDGQLDLFAILNDRIADGRDVSWIWDADWELLIPHIRHVTCSGTRAAELALRLHYAGLELDRITVVDNLEEGLDSAIANGSGELYILPTYTALLDLKTKLSDGGKAKAYWE
jgi:UDP-N-acetylmuramyl tripeptide synthase